MLILTRKLNESLVIGDDVVITVLGVKGNQVRIGVKAPRDVAVHREEIHSRIANNGANSTNGARAGASPQSQVDLGDGGQD